MRFRYKELFAAVGTVHPHTMFRHDDRLCWTDHVMVELPPKGKTLPVGVRGGVLRPHIANRIELVLDFLTSPPYPYEECHTETVEQRRTMDVAVFRSDSYVMSVQLVYYRYFRHRYPGCSFFIRRTSTGMVQVRDSDSIVGYIKGLMDFGLSNG